MPKKKDFDGLDGLPYKPTELDTRIVLNIYEQYDLDEPDLDFDPFAADTKSDDKNDSN